MKFQKKGLPEIKPNITEIQRFREMAAKIVFDYQIIKVQGTLQNRWLLGKHNYKEPQNYN